MSALDLALAPSSVWLGLSSDLAMSTSESGASDRLSGKERRDVADVNKSDMYNVDE